MTKPTVVDLDADPAFAFAPDDDEHATAGCATAAGAAAAAAAAAAPVEPGTRPGRWLDRLNPFQEQRFARRVAREVVQLRRMIEKAHPDVGGRELMRLVVMMRCKVNPLGAQRLLDEAEESFASWPTTRALCFGDVVHLIAIKEFRAQSGKAKWINANMGQIVAAEIHRLR